MVYNGSFDEVGNDGVPAGWRAYGSAEIQQRLQVADDPQRGKVARLTCTHFVPGGSDSHVMIAQVDHVAVQRGQWYHLKFWARSADMQGAAVAVSLVNRVVWGPAGLTDSFLPTEKWQPFDFVFRASQDLKPEESRLQIWFHGTGSLYMDDVELTTTEAPVRRWKPVLPMDGVTNALPNSSFECGGAGWGSWSPDTRGWGANLFQLLGEPDETRAFHGKCSWKVSLSPKTLPVRYFDYYQPVAAPQRAVLIGHEGWVGVQPGKSYVFSAYVTADRAGLPIRAVVQEAEGRQYDVPAEAGTDWRRIEVKFTAERPYACAFVGLDLRQTEPPEGTIWVDALQFEQGDAASAYQPRQAVESFVATDSPTGIVTGPAAGIGCSVSACNSSNADATVKGTLTVTDYLDRVIKEEALSLPVPAGRTVRAERSVAKGLTGFFRLRWQPEGGLPTSVRAAAIQPPRKGDTAYGFNHAFPFPFLIRLSQEAGMGWWRDWSVKWQTVQPKPDGFDFSIPDAQIDRVLAEGGQVLVLLPFPSAAWAAAISEDQMAREAGNNASLRERLPTSFKPKRIEDFAAYVRASVEHYRNRTKVFEILNEPLFTNYAVPGRFNYKTSDYVELLQAAYKAAKAACPDCTVIGGISGSPDMAYLSQFIEQGGMQWCDVLNYHAYPHKGWPETFEDGFRQRWEQLKALGQAKPIWMTEIGIYGDDDPPSESARVGDNVMSDATRPSELAAAADIVRFVTIVRAYGVAKIFYHAGTASAMHGSSAGNIFFEYGGRPRKQYPAQAALSQLLGADAQFVRAWTEPAWLKAYEFRSNGRTVVVLWTRSTDAPSLDIPSGLRALDLMGNPIKGRRVGVTDVPMYLVSD